MNKSVNQIIKYGIVGFIGLGIDFLFFFIFRDLCSIPYWLANPMGQIIAITNNFILNSIFTFKTKDKWIKRAISFFSVAAIGVFVSSILLPWGVRIVNIYFSDFINTENQKMIQNVTKIVVTLFVAFLQFFVNKYFTFKTKEEHIGQ